MNRRLYFGAHTLLFAERFTENELWIPSRLMELGFDAIDLSVMDPEVFPAAQTRREILQSGIRPVITTALQPEYNPVSPDPALRKNAVERLKRIVDVANEVGADIVGGVIASAWGYKTGRARTRDEWLRSVECTREVAQHAKETGGVVLTVEVINRYVTHFLNIAEDGVRYCEDTGMDNVKVLLDSFHMMIEEESVSKAMRRCGKRYLGYFHTSESHRGIPGTGLVPWKEVFDTLGEIGYEGPLSIETYDPRFETLAANSCIWRKMAESGEDLAVRGLAFFKTVVNASPR